MYEYTHGGNAAFEPGGAGLLDLSANINPLGFPQEAAQAVIDSLADCASYPDAHCRALRQRLGEYEGVPPEWIFCGAGASDILFRLPRCVGAKKAWTLSPTFSDYERSVRSFGARMACYQLTEKEGFLVSSDALRHLAQVKPDLVFLCNPNNPTGLLTDRAFMEKLVTLCQELGAIVVVDECFLDFVLEAQRYSMLALTAEYENLVVLKAFTKTFAMPGLRLGYAVTRNQRIMDGLAWHGPDWAVSVPTQAAGLAVLPNADAYLKRTVRFVATQRERLSAEMRAMGYCIFNSAANYLFFQTPSEFDLLAALNQKGIRIRPCANYRGLSRDCYRVAVSTVESNGIFLAAMREVTPWHVRS